MIPGRFSIPESAEVVPADCLSRARPGFNLQQKLAHNSSLM